MIGGRERASPANGSCLCQPLAAARRCHRPLPLRPSGAGGFARLERSERGAFSVERSISALADDWQTNMIDSIAAHRAEGTKRQQSSRDGSFAAARRTNENAVSSDSLYSIICIKCIMKMIYDIFSARRSRSLAHSTDDRIIIYFLYFSLLRSREGRKSTKHIAIIIVAALDIITSLPPRRRRPNDLSTISFHSSFGPSERAAEYRK